MNGATLYAAETNTECLAATTTAEFWVVIKGVISYFIFRSASFLIARCYSVPAEIRQLWIPSVRFLLSLWWSHFHRVFPSNAYRRPSPPASPANWFFLSFFIFFIYIYINALGLRGNAVSGAVSYSYVLAPPAAVKKKVSEAPPCFFWTSSSRRSPLTIRFAFAQSYRPGYQFSSRV